MKRVVIQETGTHLMGKYQPEPNEQEPKCTWAWNKQTGEVHDLTDTASVCVGYAKTPDEVME